MKLHQFTASNNQKAISMIHEKLGAEALIYSTKTVPNGVQMVAGLPHRENSDHSLPTLHEAEIDEPDLNKNFVDTYLQTIVKQVKNISDKMDKQIMEHLYLAHDESTIKRNQLLHYLSKIGIRGNFCYQFIKNYLLKKEAAAEIDEASVTNALLPYIKTDTNEACDQQKIIALVGPTGVGKTTAIVKLAKRYLEQFGQGSIGFITTDYQDVKVNHQLLHFSKMLNVELEYAHNQKELSLAIVAFNKKKIILIDTHGISQRNHQAITHLLTMLENQANNLSTYITLPCNVQEPILDEVARAFKSHTVRGALLTKEDECISIASAVSTSINHQLSISYISGGQGMGSAMQLATPELILKKMMIESVVKKQMAEENFAKNSVLLNAADVFDQDNLMVC